MKTLKGKFLVAVIALGVIGGAFANIGEVSAYEVSHGFSDKYITLLSSKSHEGTSRVEVSIDENSPYEFIDNEENKEFFIGSLRSELREADPSALNEIFVSVDDIEIHNSKISLNVDRMEKKVHDLRGVGGDGVKLFISFVRGFDPSKFQYRIKQGRSFSDTYTLYKGKFRLVNLKDYRNFYSSSEISEIQEEEEFSIGGYRPAVNIVKVDKGAEFNIDDFIVEGANHRVVYEWIRRPSSELCGDSYGAIGFSYKGGFRISGEVPVVASVCSGGPTADAGGAAISIQAPNTGFENQGFFAMVLAGISAATILTAIFFKKK